MTMLAGDGHIHPLLSMLLKASVLQAVGAASYAVLGRRGSAATRHVIWTITVAGLLLLPVLSIVLPAWQVLLRLPITIAAPVVERAHADEPIRGRNDVAAPVAVTMPVRRAQTNVIADISWPTALPVLYAAGVLLLLARLAAAQIMIRRLARRANDMAKPEFRRLLLECTDRMGVRRRVRLLRGRECMMPMVFGTRVPTILLPSVADTWSQDRRRAVLRHELAHVARYDCLTQLAAEAACAAYWIYPSIWWIARRLRIEQELACDDRVLKAGTHARGYAGHLLELAYSLGGQRAPALAVSMARLQHLEGRMRAILDTARNRTIPALRVYILGIAIMTALLVPLAAATAKVLPSDLRDPQSANPTTTIDTDPLITIRSITFVGNQAIASGTLRRQMTGNTERRIWLRLFGGRSPYQEAWFTEDKEKIEAYYRDHGYITARVGAAKLKVVRDLGGTSPRIVDLSIPIVEGDRYKLGEIRFAGNTVVTSDVLRQMFNFESGTYYSEKMIRQGLEKVREAYGANGYFEFTGYPDFRFHDRPSQGELDIPNALSTEPSPATAPPIVDVTVRLNEGTQFFLKRLAFTGSTAKQESLLRREVRLVEGDVFNTEALKDAITHLNQLGYFKPIKGGTRDVVVQKIPGEPNKVDVTLNLANR